MKNNKIWYLGCLIGILSLLVVFLLDLNKTLEIILTQVFAISFTVSYVKIIHNKMLKEDLDYRISINDERNEKIRDKVNATMSAILMVLMGIIAIISMSIKAYLPAIFLGISVFISPLIMIFISRYYESRY
ncbi:DUF2178 domain-containing protein [Anaerococcus sp. AGMB00486]|uniref:DUF2178 domain-containing protein n=2 Tax=Anaerococcus TaxID=165779 RepID=A0ABX2NAV0_9FIRM|nr:MULTISPECIES: DUF2178 domain-containing protein [Anaerococcus]MDY3006483.1 DUF2178 domain-containing protein [Anaerococcus porci]MSS78009.1 DUF2178 domain-containing protein [Anaerococcus porci]NVF11808.1 DUF2178 domain-containing protein [Anaerococcus faecalis]